MINQIDQLQYESDCWKRILEFILVENSFCKDRLSDVIRSSRGEINFMDQAEIYQNYFIQEEILISLIKSDISFFQKLLKKKVTEDDLLVKEVMSNRKKISKELEKLEHEFIKMKLGFNNFLEGSTLRSQAV